MSISHIKYQLRPGSPLLRKQYWQEAPDVDLRNLIMRFATKEQQTAHVRSGSLWRSRRLAAVAVFEKRFGPVPQIFSAAHVLKSRISRYDSGGNYIWPLRTQLGVQADAVNGAA